MPRGDQLARQWRIIQSLSASKRGKRVRELSGILDCHPRTVYRDLEALQQAGFPVYTDWEDGRSRWKLLDPTGDTVPVPFRISELIALYFGRDMIRPLKGTPFHTAMETLFQKIRATLPEETASHLDRMSAHIGAGAKPHKDYSRFSSLMETVGEALLEHRHLDIRYHSMGSGEDSTRRIAPYHLWFFDGTFYLIAYCLQRDGMRTFAIDRIRSCRLTEDRFTVPDTFDPTAYVADSFGVFKGKPVTVRVRFSPEAAGYIRERTWHHSQRLVDAPDGSLLFEAEVADSDEIRAWILSWGANAEVLSPDPLRSAVKRHVRRMVERYESDG